MDASQYKDYVPMQNRGGHRKYFESYFQAHGDTLDRIIDPRSSTVEDING